MVVLRSKITGLFQKALVDSGSLKPGTSPAQPATGREMLRLVRGWQIHLYGPQQNVPSLSTQNTFAVPGDMETYVNRIEFYEANDFLELQRNTNLVVVTCTNCSQVRHMIYF